MKSVDANKLVITRAGKKPAEMTFDVRSSTLRQGTITAGATVQVRYRTEGRSQVATAIVAVEPTRHADEGRAPKSL